MWENTGLLHWQMPTYGTNAIIQTVSEFLSMLYFTNLFSILLAKVAISWDPGIEALDYE